MAEDDEDGGLQEDQIDDMGQASGLDKSPLEAKKQLQSSKLQKGSQSHTAKGGVHATGTVVIPNFNIDAKNMIQEKRGQIAKDYQILELLGKGGFGEVKKVVHRLTRDVRAMKIIKKDKCDENYLATLTNEIKILK